MIAVPMIDLIQIGLPIAILVIVTRRLPLRKLQQMRPSRLFARPCKIRAISLPVRQSATLFQRKMSQRTVAKKRLRKRIMTRELCS